MSLFLETIKVVDGSLTNIEYHNQRFNRTRADFFEIQKTEKLEQIINIPENLKGVHKCKLVYGKIIRRIVFEEYHKKQISNLKLVVEDNIDYAYKFSDRDKLNTLKENSGADEIIIVKNGLVTDTSYSNLCFFDGEKWFTPENPLLKGTKRQCYLDQNIIFEKEIKSNEIQNYSKISLINAMLNLGEIQIPVEKIKS